MSFIFSFKIFCLLAINILLAIYLNYYFNNLDSENQLIKLNMALLRGSVFVLGASGEVGKELVKSLASQPQITKVTLISRKNIELPKENSDKFNQVLIDFDKMNDYSDAFSGHETGICSLGTTRAKSGADGFYKVDHDYVLNAAKLAKDNGCKHFNLVSSVGANKNSYFLYSKTKGEIEEEVTNLNFERLSIYRPGLLLCDRTESRPTEKLIRSLSAFVDMSRSFSLETSKVAQGIVNNLFKETKEKVEILHNKDIRDLAKANQ